jgi:hypothetical protein
VTAGRELVEVALMTTSDGPIYPDVFFLLIYDDGSNESIPMGEEQGGLLERLQQLPGFDNETFIQAMGIAEEGISVLWRRSDGASEARP